MSLTIQPISLNNKQSFGARISKEAAGYILEGKYPQQASDAVYEACEAIVGPKIFNKGIVGVIEECADTIKKQFPNITKEKFPQAIDVKPIYDETSQTKHALDIINDIRESNDIEGKMAKLEILNLEI